MDGGGGEGGATTITAVGPAIFVCTSANKRHFQDSPPHATALLERRSADGLPQNSSRLTTRLPTDRYDILPKNPTDHPHHQAPRQRKIGLLPLQARPGHVFQTFCGHVLLHSIALRISRDIQYHTKYWNTPKGYKKIQPTTEHPIKKKAEHNCCCIRGPVSAYNCGGFSR